MVKLKNFCLNLLLSFFDSPWPARLRAALEVLAISGLVSNVLAALVLAAIFGRNVLELSGTSANFLVAYLLLDSAFTFLILWALMATHEETLAGIGLRWSHWKINVTLGLVLVPLLLIVNFVVSVVFQLFLPQHALKQNPLMETIQSPAQLALFVLAALVAGGVREELQRAFILRRFHRRLGGSAVGLVVWSLAFGAGHYVQGAQGIVAATFFGFAFGALYLMRNNLVGPVTAHAVYDSAALLVYWFFLRDS